MTEAANKPRSPATTDNGPTVAVSESCTGGLLAAKIVDIPGSGQWFMGGLVAYDSAIKHRLLDVPEGPVITPDAAMQMAAGVRGLIGSDIGLATTGVAGPDSEEGQPVGTVFIGIADDSGTRALRLDLDGDPTEIREAAAQHGVGQVLQALEKWALRSASADRIGS